MGAFQAGLILLRMDQYPGADHLSGTDVLVLAALFSFAADDKKKPVAYPSASRVAARTRLGLRTVKRAMKRLEEVGVITGDPRDRRPTRWTLDPYFTQATGVGAAPDQTKGTGAKATPPSVGAAPDKGQSGTSEVPERHQRGATAAPECTEEGSEAKRRNRTDVQGGFDSSHGSAALRRDSSAAPPGEPPAADPRLTHGPPEGASVWVGNIEIRPGGEVIEHPEPEAWASHGQS